MLSLVLQVALKVPVVVRLEGTNVDQGKRILKVNWKFNGHKFSYIWTIIDVFQVSLLIGNGAAGKWNDTNNGRRFG